MRRFSESFIDAFYEEEIDTAVDGFRSEGKRLDDALKRDLGGGGGGEGGPLTACIVSI